MTVTYVLIARIPPAGVEAFQRYEAAVLPLLAEHGGRLARRLRADGGEVEVHLVEFASAGAFDAYRADPRRAAARGAPRDERSPDERCSPSRTSLRREPHGDHVAVGHRVVAALEAQRAAVARAGVAAGVDERVPADDLGADEALLDVGVDLARPRARRSGRAAGARTAPASSSPAVKNAISVEQRERAARRRAAGRTR